MQGIKVNVEFPDGKAYPFYFSRVPCLNEYVETKRGCWTVISVIHHADESFPKEIGATVVVERKE